MGIYIPEYDLRISTADFNFRLKRRQSTSSSAMDEEWTIVRNGPRARKQNNVIENDEKFMYKSTGNARRRKRASPRPQIAESTSHTIASIKRNLEQTEWWKHLASTLQTYVKSRPVSYIACLGLGSFVNTWNARHQFACALLLKDMFCNDCCISDPIMTNDDVTLATDSGFKVVDANNFSVRVASHGSVAILFMPHCGRDLYECILKQFDASGSEAMILVGNTLSTYCTLHPERTQADCSQIAKLQATNCLHETKCASAKLSTSETAFNDLCISTFTTPITQDVHNAKQASKATPVSTEDVST